jgi:hypothetical protein
VQAGFDGPCLLLLLAMLLLLLLAAPLLRSSYHSSGRAAVAAGIRGMAYTLPTTSTSRNSYSRTGTVPISYLVELSPLTLTVGLILSDRGSFFYLKSAARSLQPENSAAAAGTAGKG